MACRCVQGVVCETHPDRPPGHDHCGGAGMPCPDPSCPWWRGPAPAALDTSDWIDLTSTRERPPRRRDH